MNNSGPSTPLNVSLGRYNMVTGYADYIFYGGTIVTI